MQRLRHILGWIVKALSAVVPACLLLSYLSVYISPAKWWIFAFFGLFMPVLAMITLLLGLCWLIAKRRIFWIFLIALVPSLFHLPSFVQFGHKKKIATDETIKALTYNAHMFLTNGESSLQQIAEYISRENPDIVCLQEIYGKDTNEIHRAFKQYSYRHTHYIYRGRGAYFGMSIFSRYPITERGKILFTGSGNMCTYADLSIDGKPLRVYNNHLQSTRLNLRRSFSRVRQDEHRNEEIREMSERLKTAFIKRAQQVDAVSAHVLTSSAPVLLCGDFNDTPVSYTYRKMKGKLRDTFKEAGRGFSFSFNEGAPLRIDYIFNDKRIKVINYHVARDIKFSDHYPVAAMFNMY